jgi:hypothetical protein
MSKMRVFQVECGLKESRLRTLAPFLVTKEAAEAANCRILPNSAQDVDASLVDSFGVYPPQLFSRIANKKERNRLSEFCAEIAASRAG